MPGRCLTDRMPFKATVFPGSRKQLPPRNRKLFQSISQRANSNRPSAHTHTHTLFHTRIQGTAPAVHSPLYTVIVYRHPDHVFQLWVPCLPQVTPVLIARRPFSFDEVLHSTLCTAIPSLSLSLHTHTMHCVSMVCYTVLGRLVVHLKQTTGSW